MTSEATATAEEIIVGSANLEAIRIRIKAIQGGGPNPTGLWVRRFSNQACRQPHSLGPPAPDLRSGSIPDTRSSPTRGELVQRLDADRETARGINIRLGHVDPGAVGDQRHADQH